LQLATLRSRQLVAKIQAPQRKKKKSLNSLIVSHFCLVPIFSQKKIIEDRMPFTALAIVMASQKKTRQNLIN
jgi:hypothetical protein